MTAVPQNETVTAVVSRAGGPLDGPNSLVDTRIPAPGAPAAAEATKNPRAPNYPAAPYDPSKNAIPEPTPDVTTEPKKQPSYQTSHIHERLREPQHP